MSDNRRDKLKQMQEHALYMLNSTAHPPIGRRIKNAAKSALGRGSASVSDPLFWPAGFLMLGLLESSRALGEPEVWEAVWGYLQNWLHGDGRVRHIDDAVAGSAALLLREVSAEFPSKLTVGGQATGEAAAERVFEFLEGAPKDPAGSLIYHPSDTNRCVYADGAGMTAMFLSDYAGFLLSEGKELSRAEQALDMARAQLENYLRHGMDARTGLPYHGYLLKEDGMNEKRGLVGWGRATGFLAMGFASYLRRRDDEKLRGAFFKLTSAALACQREDGLFPWLLTAPEGHIDTSATAMLGWACLGGRDLIRGTGGDAAPPFENRIKSIADGLLSRVENGRLTDSLAECVDFAEHPQRYGVYPWGQGAAMMFLGA